MSRVSDKPGVADACCEWGAPPAVLPDPVSAGGRWRGLRALLDGHTPPPPRAPGGESPPAASPGVPAPGVGDPADPADPGVVDLPASTSPPVLIGGGGGFQSIRRRMRRSLRDGVRDGRASIVPAPEPEPEQDEEMPWLDTQIVLPQIALATDEWPDAADPWTGDIELEEPEEPEE